MTRGMSRIGHLRSRSVEQTDYRLFPVSRRTPIRDPECAIASAVDVLGDWWSLLGLRDVARVRCRFDELRMSLGFSRAVLTDRLWRLLAHRLVRPRAHSSKPAPDLDVLP